MVAGSGYHRGHMHAGKLLGGRNVALVRSKRKNCKLIVECNRSLSILGIRFHALFLPSIVAAVRVIHSHGHTFERHTKQPVPQQSVVTQISLSNLPVVGPSDHKIQNKPACIE